MYLVLFSLCILLAFGFVESYIHLRKVKRVPLRILVNGTRGKTTVARLVAASLNEKGIRTLCRTTGSEAETIYPDGKVVPFERRKRASILEMKRIFSLAVEEKVDAVVIECMALQPENQETLRDVLVRPTHVIITNSYIDHVAEMGPEVEDTVLALSSSVPKTAKLYVTEDYYRKSFPNAVVAKPFEAKVKSEVPLHPASVGVAKALLNDLGVKDEVMERAMGRIRPDVGLLKEIRGKNGSLLIPTFSINDLECMKGKVEETLSQYKGKKIFLIFNSRADREYRIDLMRRVLKSYGSKVDGTYVIGDYTWKVKTYLSFTEKNVSASNVEDLKKKIEKETDCIFVGLGNIKGAGENLISALLEEK